MAVGCDPAGSQPALSGLGRQIAAGNSGYPSAEAARRSSLSQLASVHSRAGLSLVSAAR